MIINTNGFEIGDEVWIETFYNDKITPTCLKIRDIVVFDNKYIIYTNSYGIIVKSFDCLYHSKQECQLECDRLNGEYHD